MICVVYAKIMLFVQAAFYYLFHCVISKEFIISRRLEEDEKELEILCIGV